MVKSILRVVGLVIGGAMILCAGAAVVLGAAGAAPSLLVVGVLIIVGVAFERWRYKGLTPLAGPGFEQTAEQFIDPGSGKAVQVWADPKTGERRYVER